MDRPYYTKGGGFIWAMTIYHTVINILTLESSSFQIATRAT